MTQDNTYRSVGLVALVVLAAVVGSVAAAGTVAAQDAGENATNASASEEGFYSPSEEQPLNVRFRDAAANTVESVAEGVLNLNIVYGLFDGETYDVEITAPGLSDEQIDEIILDSEEYDTQDLDRTEIVGMNFTGVPAGDYEFTVSVVGGDAERTVPLEVTGSESDAANATANETTTTNESANETTDAANTTTAANESMGDETANATTTAEAANETEMGNGTAATADGNTTVTAVPSAPNTSANYTVSTVVGANATGNLSELTVNYRDSNASIGLVGGSIFSATLAGESVVNNTTAPTIGAEGRNLTIGFDGTVEASQGDRLNVTFGGVTNPPENGSYTVGVAVNNGSFRNATLTIGGNATTGNATATDETGAATGNASITAVPSGAGNESASHNVSVVAGPNATGNLTELTVNYRDSNASIGLVGGSIFSATLAGESVVNNTTAPTIGAEGRNLTIGFDGTVTVSEGDRLNISYGGVTNPPEPGTYTVGITLNNGSVRNATLEVTESTAPATTTAGGGAAGTGTTSAGTAAGTAGGETTAGTAGGTNGSGQGTEAGGPGFGIAVALVALLGAALLATRRS
ncbi:PGF-CTERM sorting domain-containing protein [Halococcus sp. AFM35]|uniref:PGF-CTERM sorting domain-containing protein n=1 Tax=Halococcus sp. AFM35 TaxID=3421653 RepID=UPI003EC08345